MASNKIKGLTVQIGADTLGLDTALKGIEQKTKKAADELKDVNKTIRITGESATLWDQKQKLLNTALDESKKKLGTLIEAQSQVKKQLADKTITGEQYRAFQREVEYAKSAVDKYEKELAEAKDKVRELGSASDAAAREVDDFGDETSVAAEKADKASKGGLTAVAVALGNFIYDAAKKATQEIVGFGKEIVHHHKTKRIHFTYSETDGDGIERLWKSVWPYWDSVSTPTISIVVEVANIKGDPKYKDFLNLQNYDVGYKGTIYVEHLGIDVEMKIVSIRRNELTGEAIQITLGNTRRSLIRQTVMSQTIVSPNSVEGKNVAATQSVQQELYNTQTALMSMSIAGMEAFGIAELERRTINELEGI